MLPLVNTAIVPTAPPPSNLVATQVADSNVQRVPPVNVSPPVSSAKTEPDARRNPQFFSPVQSQAPVTVNQQATNTVEGRQFSAQSFGAPATLLAQLIGQQTPQESAGRLESILQEYEKLVVLGQTKYRPSLASKPPPPPPGPAAKLAQQLREVQAQPTQTAEVQIEATDNTAVETQTPIRVETPVPPAQGISQYQTSLARNETLDTASA